MMRTKAPTFFSSNPSGQVRFRVSSGLVGCVQSTIGSLEAVRDVRLLHREGAQVSKFFVLLREPDAAAIELVVSAMVQIEDAFPSERFDYDTVPAAREMFVPSEARSLLA